MEKSTIVKLQLTIQGVLNHFGLFLLLSSAQNIAISFGKKNLVGMMTMLSSTWGAGISILNTLFLVKYPPETRIFINSILQAISYILVGIGWIYSFEVAVCGTIFVGTTTAFGEVSHYAFLQKFPSEYVGNFVSGSGISGLTGSLIYLILHANGAPDWVICFSFVPIAILYIINFAVLFRISKNSNYFIQEECKRLTVPNSHIEQFISIKVSKNHLEILFYFDNENLFNI